MSQQVPTIIPLPDGAPAQLCLYAIVAREQESTSIYLCNAGGSTLHAVVMRIDTISMQRYYTNDPEKRWSEVEHIWGSWELQWETVPAQSCILVNELSHLMWDLVNRYILTFSDAAAVRWQTETDDLPLNADRLAQDPENVWVTFKPIRLVD